MKRIFEKLIGLSNYVNPNFRIFFFDSDELAMNETKVRNIADVMTCDFFVFRSNEHGYHFISFNIFTVQETERVFYLFKTIYPESDYYHINNCRILNPTHMYTSRTKRGYKMKDRIQVLRVSAKTSKDSYRFEGIIGCRKEIPRTFSLPLLEAFSTFHLTCINENMIKKYASIRSTFQGETYVKLIEYDNSKFSGFLLNQVMLSVKGTVLN